jgi:hypothetical protein
MTKRLLKIIISGTLILVSCTGYKIERNGVYFNDPNEASGLNKRLIKDADPDSFVILEYEFGKDDKKSFLSGTNNTRC